MPLTLAVASLSQTEKSQFIAVLKGRAQDLSCAWTLFWEPKDFPQKVDAVIYCPKRPDSKLIADKLAARGALPIAALPPMDATASEVPLFVRMPFKPQEVVETLNAAAKRILAAKPFDEVEDDDDDGPGIDPETAYPLPVALHRIYRSGHVSASCVKLRKVESARELLCWPELELYWSYESESHLSSDSDGLYLLAPVQNPKDLLESKAAELRPIEPFLWKSAAKGFLPGALFPGLSWSMPLEMLFWPFIPPEHRTENAIRILRRISLAPASMEQIHEETRMPKSAISQCVNALLVSGALRKSQTVDRLPAVECQSLEEIMFCKSLSYRLFETLESLRPGEPK